MCADASPGVIRTLRNANVNPVQSRTAVLPIAAYLPQLPAILHDCSAALDAGHRAVYTARRRSRRITALRFPRGRDSQPMKRRLRPWIGTLALAALSLGCVAAAPVSAATDRLPDLVAPPPANPRLSIETLGDGQSHLLLRSTGYIRHAGPGPHQVRGAAAANGLMTSS